MFLGRACARKFGGLFINTILFAITGDGKINESLLIMTMKMLVDTIWKRTMSVVREVRTKCEVTAQRAAC